MSFVAELKRRKVFRVAAPYAAVAFVIAQVAALLLPALLLPEWGYRLVIVLLILGLPVALVLAWAYELTAEGLVRAAPGPETIEAGNGKRPECNGNSRLEAAQMREEAAGNQRPLRFEVPPTQGMCRIIQVGAAGLEPATSRM